MVSCRSRRIALPDRLDGRAISLAIAIMAILVNGFVFLSPVVGMLRGWPTLGKSLSVLLVVGALGVTAGIRIANTGI